MPLSDQVKFDHDGHECVAIDDFDAYCEQKARIANEWFDVHAKGVELANHAEYLAARYTQISQAHGRWLVEVSIFHVCYGFSLQLIFPICGHVKVLHDYNKT